ncbi:unnamed protein product [Calypogeia fissa]
MHRNLLPVASVYLEGEGLTDQNGVTLPVLAPIPSHSLPVVCFRRLHQDDGHITNAADVGDEHQVEVLVSVDGESDVTAPFALDSASLWGRKNVVTLCSKITIPETFEENGNDAPAIFSNTGEGGLRQIKVTAWWVAPSAVIVS